MDIHIGPAIKKVRARETGDPSELATLVCDKSYWVRQQALGNPATPAWIIDLLERVGAAKGLKGQGVQDPNLDVASLIRLARQGAWARDLVAEHPNASAALLHEFAKDRSASLRQAVADHANASAPTLSILCCDMDERVRVKAATHPNRPEALLRLLLAAGSTADLKQAQKPSSPSQELRVLAGYGGWAKYLVGRCPNCPLDLLQEIAKDADWRVRMGLLDNPNAPEHTLLPLMKLNDTDVHLRLLQHPHAPIKLLEQLAAHPRVEMRARVARHSKTPAHVLERLSCDGTYHVRQWAARHPHTPAATMQQLVRAGSSEDLLRLVAPDLSMTGTELDALAKRGLWARRLVVCHVNAAAATLRWLTGDHDIMVREWAAQHPNTPQDRLQALQRAGSSADLQGFVAPDLTLSADELRGFFEWGAWAKRLLARHPNTPPDVLVQLARCADGQIRKDVARHPLAPVALLKRLAADDLVSVRWSVAKHPDSSVDTRLQLAQDPISGVRLAVVENVNTPTNVLETLAADLNPGVAAAARERFQGGSDPSLSSGADEK